MKISKDGPDLSRIIAGVMTWGVWGENWTAEQAEAYIHQCLELGVHTFDHADKYGHYTTEELFGKATKGSSALRQQMKLISKCGIKLVTPNRPSYKVHSYDTSKEHILQSVENSLKNLQTDYLDLLLIHRPSPLMHPQEIAEAFEILKKDGKVLHFGVSNFTPSQFKMLSKFTELQTNQVEISLLHRDFLLDGTLDQCIENGIAPMAYSTMAKGRFFTDKEDPAVKRIIAVSKDLQEQYNCTYEELLTAWILRHPARILPIIGSTKIARMKAAVNATKIELSRDDWFMLWEAAVGEEVP